MDNKKTVFISGSSRGIGKALVSLFAERGWDVIAHARQANTEFEEFIKNTANENKVNIIPVYFDMRDEVNMKEQLREVISKPKITINALVNNAGICEIKLFMLTSVTAIKELFDVNLFSHMRLTQLILKRMSEGGSIVNIASIDGVEPKRGQSAYAASKAAMIAWTKTLSQELLGKIRVNTVAPHAVNTDMAHSIEEKALWKASSLIAPRDIAKAVYFLSSDDASQITGEVLKITGQHT